MAVEDKTMFEIYRESDYNRNFHCIFYTELEEHGRDVEIARAANGKTVFSGYLDDARKEEARKIVEAIVDELNDLDEDEEPELAMIERRLEPFLVR